MEARVTTVAFLRIMTVVQVVTTVPYHHHMAVVVGIVGLVTLFSSAAHHHTNLHIALVSDSVVYELYSKMVQNFRAGVLKIRIDLI